MNTWYGELLGRTGQRAARHFSQSISRCLLQLYNYQYDVIPWKRNAQIWSILLCSQSSRTEYKCVTFNLDPPKIGSPRNEFF